MRSGIACLVTLLLCLSVVARADEIRTVLLLGQRPDGHPAGTHEYLPGVRLLEKLLSGTPQLKLQVVQADEPWDAGPDLLQQADGIVLFLSEGAKWTQASSRRADALAKAAQRGVGFVGLHWALGTKAAEPIEAYLQLLGGCHGGPDRKYRVADADVRIAAPQHPITSAIESFRLREEFYYRLKFVRPADGLTPLLQVPIDGQVETVAWAWQRPAGGRSFGFTGLHFHENWRRPEYRRLIAQAVLWTLNLPIPADGLNVELPADTLPAVTLPQTSR